MAYENERKFLPKNDNWTKCVISKSSIIQSYLDLEKIKLSLRTNTLIIQAGPFIIEKTITKKDHFLLTNYLSNKQKVLRIRSVDEKLFLTLKIDIGIKGSQVEVESTLSLTEFILLQQYSISKIIKERSIVHFYGKKFEIDVFKDKNEGLILIEVELDDINEKIHLPSWVGEEVTGNVNYYNSVLAENN